MLLMSMMMMILMLAVGIVSLGIRLAWGATKFVFGLGLFCVCPVLFVLLVLLGRFSSMWLPILIVGLLLGGGFKRL